MRITTEAELRELVEEPHPFIRDKAISVIDEASGRFIQASTFFLLATRRPDGQVTVSPRGEPAGAAVVLDPQRLAFADRPGNRRLDSLRNILQCPDVGLLFMVPGHLETLRVNGRAALHRDPEWTDAPIGIEVEVDELFLHCSQSIKRGSLWEPSGWPEPATYPTTGEMIKSTNAARAHAPVTVA
ncbi:MSMEG_1061 family FMN-dependent PPOX-type flavoprotein [Symbioplanes lichenis]|uniref:MSMEG_1061 family FMN-dependent PPOX-type flavoprotein n=1 Tax=Symbioplanes lichenis TaxID=1629072 RepID=UPI00273A16EF|nr:MSMEG_1061 family FMN-dependent PPOX-type flavoprotein [Actinoplanes lichenis]